MRIEEKINKYLVSEKKGDDIKKIVKILSKRKDVKLEVVNGQLGYFNIVFDGKDGWKYHLEVDNNPDGTFDVLSGNYDPEEKQWYQDGPAEEEDVTSKYVKDNLLKWVKELDNEFK